MRHRQTVIFRFSGMLLLVVLLLVGCGGESPPQLSDRDYIKKAEALSGQQRYQDTVLVLKEALRGNPKNTEARWMLGLTYLELGDALSAEKELLKARDLGVVWHELVLPTSRAWLWAGKPQKVLDELQNLAVFPAHLHPSLWVMVAQAKAQLGDISGAFQALREAKSFGKEFVELTRFEAHLALQQKHTDLAGKVVQIGLEKWPQDRELKSDEAELQFYKGNFKNAGAAYFRLADKAAANPAYRREPLYWSALSMLLAAEFPAYEVAKNRFAKDFPRDKRHGFLEGIELMGKGQLERSESFLSTYYQDHPEDDVAIYMLGLNHLAQGNWQQALDYLNRYSQKFTSVLEARQMEAIARSRLGQGERASAVLLDLVFSHSYDSEHNQGTLRMLATNALDQLAKRSKDFLLRYDGFGRKGLTLPLQADNAAEFARWVMAPWRASEVRYPQLLEQIRRKTGAGVSGGVRGKDLQLLFDAILMRDFGFVDDALPDSIQRHGSSKDIKLIHVLAMLEQGKVTEARSQLRQLSEDDSTDADLARFYATALVVADDHQKALSVLEDAVARDEQDPRLRQALVAVYLYLDKLEQAFKLMASEPSISSEHARLLARYQLLKSDPEAAQATLLAAKSETDAKDDIGNLRTQAMFGNWAVVKEGLAKLAEIRPQQLNSPEMLVVRGALAKQEKDFATAIDIWTELIKQLPGDNDLKVTLIDLYRLAGQNDQALHLARVLQRAEVHLARGHVLSGDILVDQGAFRSASMEYQSAYNMEAKRSTVLKRYEAQIRIPDWLAAADGLAEWLGWHQDVEVRRLLIDAQYKSGNRLAAIKTAEHWMLTNKADAALLSQMIDWIGSDSPARVSELIDQGYRNYPQDPVFLEHKLGLLEKNGEWTEMVAALDVHQREHGVSPRWKWWLGKAYMGLGQSTKAVDVLKSLLDDDKAGKWADSARKLLKETAQQEK